eukprot:sb/3471694/
MAMLCYDAVCHSDTSPLTIPCDQSDNSCVWEGRRPFCFPGDFGNKTSIPCHHSDFFRCYCQHDDDGMAWCDCRGAIWFWAITGLVIFLFLSVMTWSIGVWCAERRRRRRDGYEEVRSSNMVVAQNQAAHMHAPPRPTEIEPLLPPPDLAYRTAAPPSYDEVVNVGNIFATAPSNPAFLG